MTKKKIKIPIYNQSIVVIITEEENPRYKAFVDYVDGYITALFVKKHLSDGIIVHECVHLVNFLYRHIGAELDINNDEHQAYLTQYIYEQIKNIINNGIK